jgi:NAD kinase
MTKIYHYKESEISNYLLNLDINDDNIFIIGGDGTYLKTLSSFEENQIPNICAFNGWIEFLLPLKKQNYKETID